MELLGKREINKYLIVVIFGFIPYILKAQNKNGITWIENLSWNEIKAKAKNENKYVFLDCYASWCGPCKRMEEEVYNRDTVGDIINQSFLPVKVQMDKTDHDEKSVQKWYKDADNLGKSFRVNAYPTLIFLSPNGTILLKEVGYKNVEDFLALAKNSTRPGIKYDDPYREYDSLINEYANGNKVYSRFPSLIKTSKRLGDTSVMNSLTKDYYDYLLKLPREQLYSKENIEFIATTIRSPKEKVFKLFYPNGEKVDQIMEIRGYAERVVDRVVRIQITNSRLENCRDSADLDWKEMYNAVRKQFSEKIAVRSVLAAKVQWYEYNTFRRKGYEALYLKFLQDQVQKYGVNGITISLKVSPDISFEEARDLTLNDAAWHIFQSEQDKSNLNLAADWMKDVVARSSKIGLNWQMATTDTYANLLYKMGKNAEAIDYEEKVVTSAKKKKDAYAIKRFTETLDKMKIGSPTWE